MTKIVVKSLVASTCLGLVLLSCSGILSGVSAPAALTGIVSSDAEGMMEGVVVSAERVGGRVTVSVVSNKEGRYVFPASRLVPGAYRLHIRAVGYDAAEARLVAHVGQGRSEVNIRLSKTRDLASQLTSAEWLMSLPGNREEKQELFDLCVHCHSLAPVLRSTYDAAGWKPVLQRMWSFSVASTINKPVPSPTPQLHESSHGAEGSAEDPAFENYLSSINSSPKSRHDFESKTMPRPRGDNTRVIITEYDLPRPDSEPHDVAADVEGMVWYADYAEGIIGRLNPSTGEVKEWQDPLVKPGYNGGFHDLEFDNAGNPWVGRHEFNGFAKFDKKTEKFVNWSIPQDQANPRTRTNFLAFTRDGKLWIKDAADHKAFLFDPETEHFMGYNQFPAKTTFTELGPFHHTIYGMNADLEGNEYGADVDGSNIVKIDVKNSSATIYPIPAPNSGPRRMHLDSDDRFWIGEMFANKIAMFDTRTGRFQEWPHPLPWYGPYDVVRDKDGNVWTGGMSTDFITRFNPKTMVFRYYLLPHLDANVRRVDVDNTGTQPILWVGENHQAKIAKVEPLN